MDELRGIETVKSLLKAKLNKNNKKTPSRLRAIKSLRKEIEVISLATKKIAKENIAKQKLKEKKEEEEN